MSRSLSTYLDDLVARLAMEEDRHEEAREAAGLRHEATTNAQAAVPEPVPVPKAPARRHGPVTHRVAADVREYVVPDFRPGIDACEIELRTDQVDIIHWQGPGGTVLCIDDAREQLVVAFLGLTEPPFDDITLGIPGPDRQDPGFLEAFPVDHSKVDSEAVIATPFAGPAGDGPMAEFWGFDAQREVVEVMRSPEAIGEASVEVSPTHDGRDAMVTIDGRAAAILRGAPRASLRNVRIVATPSL